MAAPGPGIIKFGAFDGESTLSIFEFHCLLRPEYRLPCTPLKSFRLALALTTVIDYVQTGDVVWKGGEEAALFQKVVIQYMTHGPALIEFVPYVLGCVSINNILLRTGGGGGGGGWVGEEKFEATTDWKKLSIIADDPLARSCTDDVFMAQPACCLQHWVTYRVLRLYQPLRMIHVQGSGWRKIPPAN